MKSISSSHLACRALGLQLLQSGPVLEGGDVVCGLCGDAVSAGELVVYFEPPDDWESSHIHPTRGPHICIHCNAIIKNNDVLTRFSRTVFVEDGAYRLTTAQDVVWLILKAPAPLVAVFNTKKSAQMVWHTPVTYDKRAIGISWGGVTGVIRVHAVRLAYEALARLSSAHNAETKSKINWPVEGLSLRDDVSQMLELLPSHSEKLRTLEDQQVKDDLNSFDSLRICEKWALSAIILASVKIDTKWDEIQVIEPPMLVKQYGVNHE